MKKYSLLLITVVLYITTSCLKDNLQDYEYNNNTIYITGVSKDNFYGHSSRTEIISNLTENDSIIFSSTGGIVADRDTLIYKDLQWHGLKRDEWENNFQKADYCAIYPILETYDEKHLYHKNNELKDIVCCKSTEEYGQKINLSFSHVFAKVSINIDNALNCILDKINITIPYSIESIDTKTGEIKTNSNKRIVELQNKENSCYEIMVPACSGQKISFEIIDNKNNRYNANLSNESYQKGCEYVCHVRYNNGIYTKEDFIAFSHLINGKEYKGRKLEDFYVIKDGKRIFNLFADIEFNQEETALIQGIGNDNNHFNDIFDGNNHTISGINYNSSKDFRGIVTLFEFTTTSSIIRNVKIADITAIESKRKFKSSISFLTGVNHGTIDNCHIINGRFELLISDGKKISGLCSVNYGNIINSSVSSINSIGEDLSSGDICLTNRGYILNCRTNGNRNHKDKDKNKSKSYINAISYSNHNCIENVYTYNYSTKNYIINEIEINSKNSNLFFNKKYESSNRIYDYNKSTIDYITHNDTPEDYSNNVKQLNEWIDTIGKEQYPQFKFRKWKTDGTSAPCFE